MTESTAMVAPEAPTDSAIEQIRRVGALEVEQRKELERVSAQIQGTQWGGALSPHARLMVAQFAKICGANVGTHIDLLGGKMYLNAAYWADFINNHSRFHHHVQRDLSPSVEKALRDRAETHRAAAEAGDDSGRLGKAADYEDEADDMALARARWSPRENATAVVETTIVRFINAAPMDKIRSGEITDIDQYLIEVSECNWAGGMGDSVKGKKDPVGDANPGTTARTRSLRRCCVKSFSAWMEKYDAQIQKAETVIEAEFEIIANEVAATEALLPQGDAPQGVLSAGEPTAQSAENAVPLPVEGAEEEKEEEFDPTDCRKRFFATLRDAGVSEKDRKKWAKSHDLPESSKGWGQAEYDKAQEILVEPARAIVRDALDGDVDALKDLSLEVLKKEAPEYLRDWNVLGATLEARQADKDADGEEEADGANGL